MRMTESPRKIQAQAETDGMAGLEEPSEIYDDLYALVRRKLHQQPRTLNQTLTALCRDVRCREYPQILTNSSAIRLEYKRYIETLNYV